jgi:hypothetical protein
MMKESFAPVITGALLSAAFIGISLYILVMLDSFPAASRHDLALYASLTGAYGIWRSIRAYLLWKEREKNI